MRKSRESWNRGATDATVVLTTGFGNGFRRWAAIFAVTVAGQSRWTAPHTLTFPFPLTHPAHPHEAGVRAVMGTDTAKSGGSSTMTGETLAPESLDV